MYVPMSSSHPGSPTSVDDTLFIGFGVNGCVLKRFELRVMEEEMLWRSQTRLADLLRLPIR